MKQGSLVYKLLIKKYGSHLEHAVTAIIFQRLSSLSTPVHLFVDSNVSKDTLTDFIVYYMLCSDDNYDELYYNIDEFSGKRAVSILIDDIKRDLVLSYCSGLVSISDIESLRKVLIDGSFGCIYDKESLGSMESVGKQGGIDNSELLRRELFQGPFNTRCDSESRNLFQGPYGFFKLDPIEVLRRKVVEGYRGGIYDIELIRSRLLELEGYRGLTIIEALSKGMLAGKAIDIIDANAIVPLLLREFLEYEVYLILKDGRFRTNY